MIATALGVLILLAIVVLVLIALCRDPDPVAPASLESGREPREAVRSAAERRSRS